MRKIQTQAESFVLSPHHVAGSELPPKHPETKGPLGDIVHRPYPTKHDQGYEGRYTIPNPTDNPEFPNNPIGMLHYKKHWDSEDNPFMRIEMLQTHPDYRRRGVATVLLQRLHQDYPDYKIDPAAMTPEGRAVEKHFEHNPVRKQGMAQRLGPGYYEHRTPYGKFTIKNIPELRGHASWAVHFPHPNIPGESDDQASDQYWTKQDALAAIEGVLQDPETYGLKRGAGAAHGDPQW